MQKLDIAKHGIYNISHSNSVLEFREGIYLKKLLSFLVCIAVVFSAAVPALAADG